MNLSTRIYKSLNYRTRHIQRVLAKHIIHLDQKNNYYIFSEPRGGSTWVTEVVQHATNKPILWEPFFKNHFDTSSKSPLVKYHFSSTIDAPEIKHSIERTFQGHCINKWTVQKSAPLRLALSKNAIIKICQGNGMLPWILNNFHFNYKPIYLVRNPLSVISSQLRHRGWDKGNTCISFPSREYSDLYSSHSQFLGTLDKKEMVLAAHWCIGNRDLLKESYSTKLIKVYYEDIIAEPEILLNAIKQEWKLSFDIGEVKGVLVNPSSTASNDLDINAIAQNNKWKKHLSSVQIENILSVCDHFKIDLAKWI